MSQKYTWYSEDMTVFYIFYTILIIFKTTFVLSEEKLNTKHSRLLLQVTKFLIAIVQNSNALDFNERKKPQVPKSQNQYFFFIVLGLENHYLRLDCLYILFGRGLILSYIFIYYPNP